MYRVFISYNTASDDMVVVWRLQTLAAASGLQLDVPNPIQRSNWVTIMQMIDNSDAVISFITKRATKQVKNEIEYALSRGKRVIPIVEQGISINSIQPLLQQSGTPVFILNPQSPRRMESELAQFLQKEKVGKDARNAIFALAGTFVSLYLLQELTKS